MRCPGRPNNAGEKWGRKWVTRSFNILLDLYSVDLPANFQAYCYEMKVIQAFSWALFIMFVVALWILFQLAAQAERFGRYQIWREPIRGTPA